MDVQELISELEKLRPDMPVRVETEVENLWVTGVEVNDENKNPELHEVILLLSE